MLEYYRFKTVHELFMRGLEEEALAHLAALQKKYVALCDENTTFKMQAQEYEDILYLARNLVFDQQFYWLNTGSIKQGPFCPACYDRDGLLIRLSGERYDRHCPACRAPFKETHPARAAASAHGRIGQGGVYAYAPEPERQRAKVIPFSK